MLFFKVAKENESSMLKLVDVPKRQNVREREETKGKSDYWQKENLILESFLYKYSDVQQ